MGQILCYAGGGRKWEHLEVNERGKVERPSLHVKTGDLVKVMSSSSLENGFDTAGVHRCRSLPALTRARSGRSVRCTSEEHRIPYSLLGCSKLG